MHQLLRLLTTRFGTLPPDIEQRLQPRQSTGRLSISGTDSEFCRTVC
ncbi:MAG TPA: hypothetical protein V6D15_22640 [Oculatellaceae cyanobacterium]